MIALNRWRRHETESFESGDEKKEIRLSLGKITLGGLLVIPSEAQGIVVFAHGSGSSPNRCL